MLDARLLPEEQKQAKTLIHRQIKREFVEVFWGIGMWVSFRSTEVLYRACVNSASVPNTSISYIKDFEPLSRQRWGARSWTCSTSSTLRLASCEGTGAGNVKPIATDMVLVATNYCTRQVRKTYITHVCQTSQTGRLHLLARNTIRRENHAILIYQINTSILTLSDVN